MKNNTEMPGYILFLRGFVFCISAFLWVLSINWSADGFSIDNAELYWIGIGLALSVTGAELLFNRGSANPTIFMVGLAAYIFGFVTNFLGISAAVGIEFSEFAVNPLKVLAASIGVAALSVIVEAAPESFLLWALYPKEKTPGDFISTLLGGSGMFKTKNVPQRSNNFISFEPANKPTNQPTNKPTNEQTNQQTNQQTNSFPSVRWDTLAPEERKIVGFARNYFQKHGMLPPSPTNVSKSLYNTPDKKGYISSVLSKLEDGKYSR